MGIGRAAHNVSKNLEVRLGGKYFEEGHSHWIRFSTDLNATKVLRSELR